MIRSKQDKRRDQRSLCALFSATFLIHLVWTAYVANAESMAFVENLRNLVSSAYSCVGFEWKGNGAYVVTAALVSSVIVNGIRRFLEGVIFGWPQFKKHDRHSITRASLSALCYGAMMYFTVGFFGEKYSSMSIYFINIVVIAVSTYIVGLLVDLIDDAISWFYCTFHGGKA